MRSRGATTLAAVLTVLTVLTGMVCLLSPVSAAAEPLVVPPDVTGDGRPDLVIVEAGRMYVYPHNGATSANPWTTRYDTGLVGWNIVRQLMLSDVTGDGKPDLLAIRTDIAGKPDSLWVYPHNGATGNTASWTAPFDSGIWGWGQVADWIGVGELTGDGRPDIVARFTDGSLWVYPHNGRDGQDANWGARYSIGVSWNHATALLLGDVTGDGRTDLVARDASGNARVHPAGSASFAAGTGWNLANVMLLADATGDGNLDVVVRQADGAAAVYPHNGQTASNPWTQPRYGAGGGWQIATLMAV